MIVSGPDDRVVWGAGLSSCGLQVADSIPVAAHSCDPPNDRGFGEFEINIAMVGNWPSSQCEKANNY